MPKKGYKPTEEHRKNISLSQIGRVHSELTKQKMRVAHLGRKRKPHTQESIEKMRVAHKGYVTSEETKKKLREINIKNGNRPPVLSGSKSTNWKGGVTPIHQIIRSSKRYKDWRKLVFERDNFTCQFCGARNGNGKSIILNADHIKPFAQFPELRFCLENGRTLCKPCHQKTETYGAILIRK